MRASPLPAEISLKAASENCDFAIFPRDPRDFLVATCYALAGNARMPLAATARRELARSKYRGVHHLPGPRSGRLDPPTRLLRARLFTRLLPALPRAPLPRRG